MQALALLTICASGFLHSADFGVDPDNYDMMLEQELEAMSEEQQDQIEQLTEDAGGELAQTRNGRDYIFGLSDADFAKVVGRPIDMPGGIVGDPSPPFKSLKTEAMWLGSFKPVGDAEGLLSHFENAEGSVIEDPEPWQVRVIQMKEEKLVALRDTKSKRHRKRKPVASSAPIFLNPGDLNAMGSSISSALGVNAIGSSIKSAFGVKRANLLELNTSIREEATTKSCEKIKKSTDPNLPMFLYYSDWHKEMLSNKPVPRDSEQQSREALARHMFGRGIEANMRRLSTASAKFMSCASYDGTVVISTHSGGLDYGPARTMLVGEIKKKGKKSTKTGNRLYKTVTGGHLRPKAMWDQIFVHIFANDIKPRDVFFLACNSGNPYKYAFIDKKGKKIKVETADERNQHAKKWKMIAEVESYANKMAVQTAKHNHGRRENAGEGTYTDGLTGNGDAFVTGFVAPKGFFVRGMGQAYVSVMNNYNGNEADPGQQNARDLWHSGDHVPQWSDKDGQAGFKLLMNIRDGHYSPHLAHDPNADLVINPGFGRWNVPINDVDAPLPDDADLTAEEIQELAADAADDALEHEEDED